MNGQIGWLDGSNSLFVLNGVCDAVTSAATRVALTGSHSNGMRLMGLAQFSNTRFILLLLLLIPLYLSATLTNTQHKQFLQANCVLVSLRFG